MVTQANANMEVVLQALNNFEYNVLQVGAQYIENGTLHLKARLEGKNPDQNKSPPIHFNLTVQENIPALLKELAAHGRYRSICPEEIRQAVISMRTKMRSVSHVMRHTGWAVATLSV